MPVWLRIRHSWPFGRRSARVRALALPRLLRGSLRPGISSPAAVRAVIPVSSQLRRAQRGSGQVGERPTALRRSLGPPSVDARPWSARRGATPRGFGARTGVTVGRPARPPSWLGRASARGRSRSSGVRVPAFRNTCGEMSVQTMSRASSRVTPGARAPRSARWSLTADAPKKRSRPSVSARATTAPWPLCPAASKAAASGPMRNTRSRETEA